MGKDQLEALDGIAIKSEFRVKENYDVNKDAVFNKYANTISPLATKKKSRSTLAPYAGPWTSKEAIHLLRRTMFGSKPSDVNAILGLTANNAVDLLFSTIPAPYPDGLNWYENSYADITGVAFGASWVNADWGDGTQDYYRQLGMKGMWLKNIINQNLSIHEKMVMFLYSLVPVSFSQIGDARFEYQYVQLLHQYATGNYKDFLRDITKNGAMLYFLNGYVNNKYSPDENYARELQELFSVGKDGSQQYTENDVREVAKVLTGWRIDDVNRTTFFDVNYHTTANKQFSAFYGNTTIIGQTGANAGDVELDDLLNMIFSGQSAVAASKYICKKLYRFFVYYDIDANTQANIIDPLAATMVANNFDLVPVLKQLFKSEHFFDTLSQGCYIKTPLDVTCGLIRTLSVTPDVATTFEDDNWLFARMAYYTDRMGMQPSEVPNVSGYKPYYQSPQWHQLFVNSNTHPKRMEWVDNLLTNYGFYVNGTTSYKANLPLFASSLSNPYDPDILIDDVIKYTFGLSISQARKDYFKAILLNNNSSNSYWTLAWTAYVGNPTDPIALGTVTTRLRLMLTEMFRLPEQHLC
jgi:Protein of unknown function (DUF1800)